MMFDIRSMQEHVIFDAVKGESSDETAAAVVFGENRECSDEDDATWVKSTMKRLEDCFDRAAIKRIRMNCQCGYAMEEKLALVNELVAASSSLQELGNLEKAKAAGLSYADGALHLQFGFCPCPMLSSVERLDTNSWCQCTTGYSKVLFEKAFGCEVDVELLKSIKMGDDICLMKIVPRGEVWKRMSHPQA